MQPKKTPDNVWFLNVLLQVLVPPGEREYHGGAIGQERVMESHECPLAIAMRFPPSEGNTDFG